jgi:hypothetical protein
MKVFMVPPPVAATLTPGAEYISKAEIPLAQSGLLAEAT